MINKNPIIVSDRYFTPLKYSSNIAFGGIDKKAVLYLYTLNGPACPIPQTGTRQPTGFDQLKTIYKRVRCHGSKIRLSAQVTANDPASSVFIAIVPTPVQSLYSIFVTATIQDIMALPYAKWKIIGPAYGHNIDTITNYMSAKKILGQKSIEYSENYSGITKEVTDKAELAVPIPAYWNVYVATTNQSNNLTNSGLFLELTIEYYCEFYDRVALKDANDVEGATGPGLGDKFDPDPYPFDYGSN